MEILQLSTQAKTAVQQMYGGPHMTDQEISNQVVAVKTWIRKNDPSRILNVVK